MTAGETKQSNTLEMLFRSARLVNELALSRVREITGKDLRASHTTLFPHIDLAGTRLTELARRLGSSKQATAQLVDELCHAGVLERLPDPKDGRARLICFAGGGQALKEGLQVLENLEMELREKVGGDRNLKAPCASTAASVGAPRSARGLS